MESIMKLPRDKTMTFRQGVEEPSQPDVNPHPTEPDIKNPRDPQVPSEVPHKPEVPARPPDPEPGVSPGKTKEPEIPKPSPPEPHE